MPPEYLEKIQAGIEKNWSLDTDRVDLQFYLEKVTPGLKEEVKALSYKALEDYLAK